MITKPHIGLMIMYICEEGLTLEGYMKFLIITSYHENHNNSPCFPLSNKSPTCFDNLRTCEETSL